MKSHIKKVRQIKARNGAHATQIVINNIVNSGTNMTTKIHHRTMYVYTDMEMKNLVAKITW